MKRLSTSLLIFILALLAVPDRAWAWSDLRLRSSIYNNWDTSYSSGTTDESPFNKVDNDVNKWTKTIDATSITEDIVFRLYTTDDGGKEVQPSEDNTDITNKGVYSSAEFVQGKGTKSFRLLQSTNHYDTYTIDAEYTDNKWNIKVTATKSGSLDPVYTYKLMQGDGTHEGTPVATFTGAGFPYTATYNIDAAGTYYFYVNDGAKNYFNENQEITTDGGSATIYRYEDNHYFNRVVKLQAPRAGEYTFKFKHEEGTRYTLQCNFPSETETKYSVAISAGTGGRVNPDGTQQIGSTGETVTATAEKGYTFDKWTTTGGVSVASTTSATTTVTATADGELTANFKATSTESIDSKLGTSSNGKAYYLATEESGENSIFGTGATKTTEGNTVTYSRILRFNDNGDGSYELNIPATISGNVWILEIDKQNNETTYRPVEAVAVGSSNPADKGSINGSFGGRSTVFTLTDRGDVDGIYKIKLNLNTSGIPAKWTITHDPFTRVAYYLSTASMSSASPVYDQRANTTDAFSNRFIGTNYFNEDSNVDYYVISNILKGNDNNYVNSAKNFDTSVAANSNWNVITTVNKLLLLGNGGLAFSDQKPNNEFSPNELPMKSSDLLKGLCAVEYNPSNGDNDKAVETKHYGIRGQIIVRQGTSSTETTSMTIVGPLVAASVGETEWIWNYSNTDETLTDGISSNNVMKFDETENCYTITIVTNNEQQGKHFRFIRNGKLDNTWTEDEIKARIPYYDNSKTGSAATVADPNYVNYGGSDSDRDIDILFNRPAGKWTIKFYIVNEASSSDGSVKSKYYYTINAEDNFTVTIPSALKKVLRTYSYGSDVKPQDENVHVYVAHSFGPATENDKYTNTKTGTVRLYEINYVPANTGVVLYCGEGIDAKTVTFVEANEYNVTNYAASKTDKTKLWKNSHEGAFNNDLEPVLARTFVDNSVKDEKSGDIIARNFCMSLFSKTKAAQGLLENSYTDYIGFFRVKSYISDNKAYLQYDTEIIKENAQIFGQVTDGVEVASAKLAMVFEGFEDDNVVTGISDNLSAKPVLTDDAYYNLQGMRVEKPVKGIYIHNGKKVVIK